MLRMLVAALISLSPLLAAPSAAENFDRHCAKCHGKDGKGQTRLGRRSGAPDFTDQARQSKLTDRKSTRLNSSHSQQSRMPSSA